MSSFDFGGAVTGTGGLLLLVYGIVEAPSHGWLSGSTASALAAPVVLSALFVVLEQRHPRPLLRLRLLRSTSLLHANFVGALLLGSYVAFQFILTPLCPELARLVADPDGALVRPIGGDGILCGAARRSHRAEVWNGATAARWPRCRCRRLFALTSCEPVDAVRGVSPPTIITTGTALAIVFPSVNIQATAGIANTEQGLASGIVNTSMQLGGALLLAVATAAPTRDIERYFAEHRHLLPHIDAALSVPAIATGFALAVTAVRLVLVRHSSPTEVQQ